jgi:hypothetical protein
MHDVMRKRLLRKLESLPDEQLYQVLDYIEFLEARYARQAEAQPDGLQRLAERLEDRLRARSVAPAAIGGTMRIIGTAGRMLDGLSEMGRDLLTPPVRTPATRSVDSSAAAAPTPSTGTGDPGAGDQP